MSNPGNLVESGEWKVGTRKIGQALAALRRGVVVIIVTYNPSLNRLAENLDAVSGQIDCVFAFDNGSQDAEGVDRLLSGAGCVYRIARENLGLAWALNETVSVAGEAGTKLAPLLDQDSVAGKGMVEALSGELFGDVVLASPQIVDRNKHEGFDPGMGTENVRRSITSGALVSLQAWRGVGGFDERLFVDWVDYEFCANLRSHGFRIVRVGSAALLHEMGRCEHAFSLALPFGRHAFYRTNHALSRQRDKARSRAIVKRKYGWSKVGREERAYIAAIALRDLALERGRLSILREFWRGGREGAAAMSNERVL